MRDIDIQYDLFNKNKFRDNTHLKVFKIVRKLKSLDIIIILK